MSQSGEWAAGTGGEWVRRDDTTAAGGGKELRPMERKSFLLRMDPALYAALERWAQQELRSVNGQIEFLLREAVRRREQPQPVEPPEAPPAPDSPPPG